MNIRTVIAATALTTGLAIGTACAPPQVQSLRAVNIDRCTAGAVAPDKARCVVVIIDEDAYGYPAGTYLRGPAYYFTTVRHTTVEDPAAF